MGTRVWKIAAVVMVLLIVGVLVFTQGFHYEWTQGSTYQLGGPENGTLILVEALPNVNVRINASFSFAGLARGTGEIVLQNGTNYFVNNSRPYVYIKETIDGRWFSPSEAGGFAFGVNLSSNDNPMGIKVVYNFPYSDFNSQYFKSKFSEVGYVAIFVFNYTNFQISAVAMPL